MSVQAPVKPWKPQKLPLSGVLYNLYQHWTGSDASFARLSVWLEVSKNLRDEIHQYGWVYRCPTCVSGALASGVRDARRLHVRDNGSGLYDDWDGDMVDKYPIVSRGRFSAEYRESEAFPQRHFSGLGGRGGGSSRRGMKLRPWKRVEMEGVS